MNERVVVFPKRCIENFSGFPGVAPISLHPKNLWDVRLITPQFELKRRGDVEDDPNWLQLIVYAVIRDSDGRVLMYNRGNKGGEERLHDKWSIGIGGHVNASDVVENDNVLPREYAEYCGLIGRAVNRELNEELIWLPTKYLMYTIAHIAMNDTPVNSVHFGVVLEVVCSHPELLRPRDEVKELKWAHIHDIVGTKMEAWSEQLIWHLQ